MSKCHGQAFAIGSSTVSPSSRRWGCASPFEPLDPSVLFAAHHAALYRYVARLTGDRDLAEDIVQETYIRLVDRPPPDPSGVRAWLFTVATNLARDDHKLSTRRRRLLADRAGELLAPPDDADTFERAEARAHVRRALAALSEKERVLLLMREEGFKHREIAEAIGTTTGSVGTLLARALAKLAAQLNIRPETE